MLVPSGHGANAVSDENKDDQGPGEMGKEYYPYVPDELILKFRDDTRKSDRDSILKDLSAKDVKDLKSNGAIHLKMDGGRSVPDTIKMLSTGKYASQVDYAEPNYIVTAGQIPDDAYRGSLWGMHNVGQTGGMADCDIDCLEVWNNNNLGSDGTVVAVIDSGVDYTHEDLMDNIWVNPGEVGTDGNGNDKRTNNIDDDGNGYKDDFRGWDFVNNDNDPMDDFGHGTHCSGTIGAKGNNGKGVAGVCWNIQIMPLKFLNSGGSGSTTNAIACVNYAAWFKDASNNNLVRITSNSWGGGSKSRTLEAAILSSNALFIASAGNSGSSTVEYPAGYTCDNIISVAATDHNDAIAPFSNYGSRWVDLGAPGVDVLSCLPDDGYDLKSGTSMAAPHVTGVAALVMSGNPTLSLSQVKSVILNSGDVVPSLNGKTVTGKRLNANNAVGASSLPADDIAPSTISDLTVSNPTISELTLTWTSPGEDGTAGAAWAYDLRYSTSDISSGGWDTAIKAIGEPGPLSYGNVQTFTFTGLEDGTTYFFAIKALDEMGNLGGLSNVPSGTTIASLWVDHTIENAGTVDRHSFAYDNNGDPAFAYKDTATSELRYAKMNRAEGTWTIVKVASSVGEGGVDIAFDDDNNPGIVYYSNNAVKFALWNGASWSISMLESGKAYNDYCSVAYSGSIFGVTYDLTGQSGGLVYRTYDGSSWTKTLVDPKAGARYNAIDFDSNGKPGIAYSDDNYGNDGWLDSMMFARWDGSKWNIEEVEGNVEGYGVFCEMTFGPDDNPRIVHSHTDNGIRYLEWDPSTSTWDLSVLVTGMGGYTGVTVTSSGVPYVSYHRPGGNVFVGSSDGSSWTIDTIVLGITSGRGICIDHFDGSTYENVGLSYVNAGTPVFVERTLQG